MRRTLTSGLPILLLIFAPFILLSPLILGGKALFWGTPALQFMPWREFAWDALQAGRLPLWNPWLGMGAPLLANYQSALLYPPTWLLFLFSRVGGIGLSAWGQSWLVVLHWIIAAAGIARLGAALGFGRLGQAVSGLAFGLSGYLVSRAGFLSINAAVAWLPWVVYYAGQTASPCLRSGGWRAGAVVKLSLVSGMLFLAGHAQTAWYAVLLAGFWSGYWGGMDGGRVSGEPTNSSSSGSQGVPKKLRVAGLIRAWLLLGLGIAAGTMLAAIQLLPTLEYLLESQRASQIDYAYAMTYSFWPWRFLTLIAPDLFGNPLRGDYWGYGNYWEDALYIGLLPLLLALYSAMGWILKRSGFRSSRVGGQQSPTANGVRFEAIPFLLVTLLVSFVLALGSNTPIFPWLYRTVPTFDMFQAPTRFSIGAVFALALLAGFGVERWRRPEKRALYWTRLGTAGALAVSIGAGLTWYLMGDVSPTFIRATALAGFWGVGAGTLSLLAPKASEESADQPSAAPRQLSWWHWTVAGFIALDLVAAGWGLNPGIDTRFYSQEPAASVPIQNALAGRRLYLSDQDEEQLKFERFLRFDTFDPGEDWLKMRAVLLPNLNMLDGIASLSNFDPLVPGRYRQWIEILSQAPGDARLKLLDLSGAGIVERIDQQASLGVEFEPLPPEVGERVRLVPCARMMSDDGQTLATILEPAFNPNREILLEAGEQADTVDGCKDQGSVGQVVIIEEQPERLVLRVEASSSGWLLLSDVWYPGWKAFVDGNERPIYRADYLFRAVPISGGESQVVFEYRPSSFRIGASLSLLAWLLLAAYAVVWRKLNRF